MQSVAARVSDEVAAIVGLAREIDVRVGRVLALADEVGVGDGVGVEALLGGAEVVGRMGRGCQGKFAVLLARVVRLRAGRGGLVPFVAGVWDVTPGVARGIVRSVREIGWVPELVGPLVSGRIGGGTIRALTRTAVAVRGTGRDLVGALVETLEVSAVRGVGEANRHVRELERGVVSGVVKGSVGLGGRGSFLRLRECGGGVRRVDGVLEPEDAVVLSAALDRVVSGLLGEGGLGDGRVVQGEVVGIEQLRARALIRLAEDSNEADVAARVESEYGLVLPARALTPTGKSTADPFERKIRRCGLFRDATEHDRYCTFSDCYFPTTSAARSHLIRHGRIGVRQLGNFMG